MIWLGFIFHLLTILAQIGLRDSKLIFLQYIFRHGDRAPIFSYPGDLNPPDFWPEGYGKLTQLGKKQHHEQGKFLRHMYKDFITSDPNEVLLNSTDLERCFSSGLSHVASLYAPTAKWAVQNNLNWQPIPIHYNPYHKDKYLSLQSECPKSTKEQERIYKLPIYLQFRKKFEPMLQTLTNYMGHALLPLEAYILYDAWYVERLYNRPLPDWASFYYDELEEFSLFAIFHFVGSPLIQRLRIGSLIGKMIEDMERKIAGEIPRLKVQVYSAQDEHLVLIMKSLRVFNDLRIPYCGTLIFELHELLDNSKAVRLLYLNTTTPENGFEVPHVLTLKGCFEYCPLDFFVNYTKHLIPQDWEKECGLHKKNKNKTKL